MSGPCSDIENAEFIRLSFSACAVFSSQASIAFGCSGNGAQGLGCMDLNARSESSVSMQNCSLKSVTSLQLEQAKKQPCPQDLACPKTKARNRGLTLAIIICPKIAASNYAEL